jgi:hypothetical protein
VRLLWWRVPRRCRRENHDARSETGLRGDCVDEASADVAATEAAPPAAACRRRTPGRGEMTVLSLGLNRCREPSMQKRAIVSVAAAVVSADIVFAFVACSDTSAPTTNDTLAPTFAKGGQPNKAVKSVSVSPSSATVAVGATVQLSASASPAHHRAEQQLCVHDDQLLGDLGAGHMAESRPRLEHEGVYARVLAPSAIQLGRVSTLGRLLASRGFFAASSCR